MTSQPIEIDDQAEVRPEDLRASPRRRQLKSAKLIFNDVSSVMNCRLRDISDTGAGIECESAQHVPDQVVLKISDGAIHDCTVVWRTSTRLGLHFIENVELKRLVAELSNMHADFQSPFEQLLGVTESRESRPSACCPNEARHHSHVVP